MKYQRELLIIDIDGKDYEDLYRICHRFNLSYDTMYHNKSRGIFKLLYFNIFTGILQYFTLKSNPGVVVPSKSYLKSITLKDNSDELLDEIEGLKEESIKEEMSNLDIDNILDKISESGIHSLTEQERDFLKSQ